MKEDFLGNFIYPQCKNCQKIIGRKQAIEVFKNFFQNIWPLVSTQELCLLGQHSTQTCRSGPDYKLLINFYIICYSCCLYCCFLSLNTMLFVNAASLIFMARHMKRKKKKKINNYWAKIMQNLCIYVDCIRISNITMK